MKGDEAKFVRAERVPWTSVLSFFSKQEPGSAL